MKVYDLRCDNDHRFEGWFTSDNDFRRQVAAADIQCPFCECALITRLPSAAKFSVGSHGSPKPPATSAGSSSPALANAWTAIARQIMASTKDVGDRFAEEARRIHYKEVPERAIRGNANESERVALRDEGIEIVALPIPAALKTSLH